jgi:hypothetical protein
MKFMMTFGWQPDTEARAEGLARFRKTGGLPPHTAKLLRRWTRADFSGGYDLIEPTIRELSLSSRCSGTISCNSRSCRCSKMRRLSRC